jgi:hypothetical protein
MHGTTIKNTKIHFPKFDQFRLRSKDESLLIRAIVSLHDFWYTLSGEKE